MSKERKRRRKLRELKMLQEEMVKMVFDTRGGEVGQGAHYAPQYQYYQYPIPIWHAVQEPEEEEDF